MVESRFRSGPSPATVWLILAASAAVFGPVPIPHVGAINLALFDLAVPALVIWGLVAGWLSRPPRPLVLGCALVVLAIGMHSGALTLLGDSASPLTLLKETIKLIAVVVLFGLLFTLLSDPRYEMPIAPAIAAPFAVLLLAIGFLAPTELYQDFHAMLGATATGLGILWILSLQRNGRLSPTAIPIAMICAAAAIWLASKTYIVIAIAMVGTCILETIRGGQPTRSVAGTAVIAAVIFAVAFGCFELLRGTVSSAPIPDAPHAAVKTAVPGVALTSVESSGARRLDLWREGLSAGLDRFPVGIGLGQFNAVVASGMPEAYLRSTSPHNTALTLFIEMGAVGLALLGATAVIVWRAVGGFPPIIAVMIFLLLGPSAVLHDVQGMRILLLLVALGLARRTPAGHSTG